MPPRTQLATYPNPVSSDLASEPRMEMSVFSNLEMSRFGHCFGPARQPPIRSNRVLLPSGAGRTKAQQFRAGPKSGTNRKYTDLARGPQFDQEPAREGNDSDLSHVLAAATEAALPGAIASRGGLVASLSPGPLRLSQPSGSIRASSLPLRFESCRAHRQLRVATVSGLTMTRASFQRGQSRESATQTARSTGVRRGFDRFRAYVESS